MELRPEEKKIIVPSVSFSDGWDWAVLNWPLKGYQISINAVPINYMYLVNIRIGLSDRG